MAKFNPSRTSTPDLDVDSGTLSVDESNDRVGIGTTNPSDKLTVAGSVSGSGIFTLGTSLSSSGDVAVTGTVHAAYFYGDGSGLTNVSDVGTASSLSGTTSQVTTGYETSGFLKVTGSSTLNVVTATTISASSNLTAVGNATVVGTLNVTGNADFNGTITCDDSITIDSVTITDTEAGYLDGLTLGTVAASKVITVDSNKDFSGHRNMSGSGVLQNVGNAVFGGSMNVTGNIDCNGTITCDDSLTIDSVTITDTELAYLDGLTLGTVAASKVITVDSNKDFAGYRNISGSGKVEAVGDTIIGGNLDVSGSTTIAGQLTSTQALQCTVVSASSHLTAVGNATVVGTLNVTGNADFNGTITCDDSITIDSTTITDTELAYLDGLTLGTVAASKVVTVDSSKDFAGHRNMSGSGVLQNVGNTILGGDLNVSGTTTLAGVTNAQALSATVISASSNLTAVGNATVVGTLNVTGNADFNGTITCDDSITIDSTTITDTELAYLDGLTLGTVAASKVVTVDSNKDFAGHRNMSGSGVLQNVGNTILGGNLNVTGNIDCNGTVTCDDSLTIDSVTITDTELAYLDGLTLGTVAGSKVITVDSNKDFSGHRNVSGSGILQNVGNTIIGGNLNVSGAYIGNAIVGTIFSGSSLVYAVNSISTSGQVSATGSIQTKANLSGSGALQVVGNTTMGGSLKISGTLNPVEGTPTATGGGFNAADPTITVHNMNGEIVTTILVDIGGGSIVDSGTLKDIIGENDTAAAYLTRVTTAINGIIYKVEMSCIEVPDSADDNAAVDIDLVSNSNSLAEDATYDSAGSAVVLIDAGGVWTAGTRKESAVGLNLAACVDDYLYLANGTGANSGGTYNAGKFIIKLYGASF